MRQHALGRQFIGLKRQKLVKVRQKHHNAKNALEVGNLRIARRVLPASLDLSPHSKPKAGNPENPFA